MKTILNLSTLFMLSAIFVSLSAMKPAPAMPVMPNTMCEQASDLITNDTALLVLANASTQRAGGAK